MARSFQGDLRDAALWLCERACVLLPKYRGAAPIQWAVIEGEKVSGVTTMRMDEGLDTGDMIMKEEVVLDPKETGGSLFEKLSRTGAALCVKTLAAIEAGTAVYTPQDPSQATKVGLIHKQFGLIDWKNRQGRSNA